MRMPCLIGLWMSELHGLFCLLQLCCNGDCKTFCRFPIGNFRRTILRFKSFGKILAAKALAVFYNVYQKL